MPEKKKAVKKKQDEAVKCYYCDGMIERANDLVIKRVPLAMRNGKVRNYNRKLHLDCVVKYNEGLEDYELRTVENDEWEKAYNYFRDEILGMKGTRLDDKNSHLAKRLLGLRLGQYYPSGNNTRLLPRGYSFNTILLTLKVVNPKVQVYLKTANFANFKHKVDGCMKFVVAEIPDVAKRIETQKRANEQLDNEKIDQPSFDYKEELRKRKEEEAKEKESISDDIALLLGGSL